MPQSQLWVPSLTGTRHYLMLIIVVYLTFSKGRREPPDETESQNLAEHISRVCAGLPDFVNS